MKYFNLIFAAFTGSLEFLKIKVFKFANQFSRLGKRPSVEIGEKSMEFFFLLFFKLPRKNSKILFDCICSQNI